MKKDITKEEANHLRYMAAVAFRNSIGATEYEAVKLNRGDYTTLDLNFLWHFKMMIEAEEREKCAKICDAWPDYDVQGLATAIRSVK